jgi:hypothetical protein
MASAASGSARSASSFVRSDVRREKPADGRERLGDRWLLLSGEDRAVRRTQLRARLDPRVFPGQSAESADDLAVPAQLEADPQPALAGAQQLLGEGIRSFGPFTGTGASPRVTSSGPRIPNLRSDVSTVSPRTPTGLRAGHPGGQRRGAAGIRELFVVTPRLN